MMPIPQTAAKVALTFTEAFVRSAQIDLIEAFDRMVIRELQAAEAIQAACDRSKADREAAVQAEALAARLEHRWAACVARWGGKHAR